MLSTLTPLVQAKSKLWSRIKCRLEIKIDSRPSAPTSGDRVLLPTWLWHTAPPHDPPQYEAWTTAHQQAPTVPKKILLRCSMLQHASSRWWGCRSHIQNCMGTKKLWPTPPQSTLALGLAFFLFTVGQHHVLDGVSGTCHWGALTIIVGCCCGCSGSGGAGAGFNSALWARVPGWRAKERSGPQKIVFQDGTRS